MNSMLAGGSTDLSKYCNKTEVDAVVANINFSNNHYTKAEVADIDNELSALILNTYTETEIDTSLSDYSTVTYLQDGCMTSLLITQALMNNCASIAFINTNRHYLKTEIDSSLSDSYFTKSEIDTTLNLYSPTAPILNIFLANYTLIIHLYHQPKQEHFITIKLKLIICSYHIAPVLMLIIPFTVKLKLVLY